MKRTVWLWQLFGFAVASLLGTILHFLYEWLGESPWIAPFSGVNESTWEHMKLLFWPLFLYAIFQSFFFRGQGCFWCIKLKGTLLGLSLIPLIFYMYNGVIGRSPDVLNVTIFFISAAASYIYEARQFRISKPPCRCEKISLILMIIIAALFVAFTFRTPHVAIFKDPVTGGFGIP